MARWQVTLQQPVGATPGISVVLECFNESGYSRSKTQSIQVGERTPVGTATLKGRLTGDQFMYSWVLVPDLPAEKMLDLEALVGWQDSVYAAGLDGHLVLIDEVRTVYPAPNPHPKELVTGVTTTPYGWEYGFAAFPVKIVLPDKDVEHIGRDNATGNYTETISITVIEL